MKAKSKRWERGGSDRVPQFLEHWGLVPFLGLSAVLLTATGVLTWLYPVSVLAFVLVGLFFLLGLQDALQTRHSVRRNFPVLGRLRYLMESVRPEIRQYFVESDREENPFSREMRSVIYQRSKATLDTIPFGTKSDVYEEGYEWIAQSLAPTHPEPSTARVWIGKGSVSQPYNASLFNVSAMSYGSLSRNAVLALSRGAQAGGFYVNTGEGGVSEHHLAGGADLVWQLGTAYFGCRTSDGKFDPNLYERTAREKPIRMIELKLSQGAKPAHGGILPGAKVTAEIAAIRGVAIGETVHSPSRHSAFATPIELCHFIEQLRDLSGGKPVGFKLCVGHPRDLFSIVKAMLATNIVPDFITVDGAEGGTGAAPLEFSNSVGMPLQDGLQLVHNALIGAGLRQRLKLISAGKLATGFHVVRQLALGADCCNAARAMMFALGCIQALKCNTNECPVGIATQSTRLQRGLVVLDKAARVASFHERTVASVLELVGAAGLCDPDELRPHHVFRRISHSEVRSLDQVYGSFPEGCLSDNRPPAIHADAWNAARAESFG